MARESPRVAEDADGRAADEAGRSLRAPPPLAAESESIDLRAYWRVILRRRWLVIPFFVAAVLVTTLVTLRQTKIHDATCTIIIDIAAPKVLDTQQMQDVVESGPGGYWYSKEYYETQYKVITSRSPLRSTRPRFSRAHSRRAAATSRRPR